jgi:hypothetical protein
MSNVPIKVFISYAHDDESLRKELDVHLKSLEQDGLISSWHDREILAGQRFDDVISDNLEQADIILFLVSPHFIASDYCSNIEVKRALERYQADDAAVVPVIMKCSDWQNKIFGKLQALPPNGKPVVGSHFPDRDEAYLTITQGIRKLALAIREKKAKIAQDNYRQMLRQYLEDDLELSFFEESNLKYLAQQLHLPEDSIKAIHEQELKFVERCNNYRDFYKEVIHHEFPVSSVNRKLLDDRKLLLQLNNEIALRIEKSLNPKPIPVFPITGIPSIDPSNILFTKNVKDPSGWAYTAERLGVIGNSSIGCEFELWWRSTSSGAGLPSCGDCMILHQRAKVTHLVEFLDNVVIPRESGTGRRVKVVWMPKNSSWESLPHQKEILGFNPAYSDGSTHALTSPNFSTFRQRWDKIEDFQKHFVTMLHSN